ncbi:DUF3768 domain-containing protein [Labrenzia sp. PHM005]|uniref:DUF3768 domain-containing protein n=1 Tax=Labrenzia sp. PHM005 TaxID=2590016 RepID=UPI0011403586|nr:DUF3768 domain-containing protein [Labrenzia sp. PHM005]QDG74803.1 DUF3768 domain-containing protein [Labrenzia sp. PHM005]
MSACATACQAEDRSTLIARLNDAFRTSFQGGSVMLTQSVAALSNTDQFLLFALVQQFEDFTPDNDPYGEHDFGSVDLQGNRFFWKIDCYDLDMTFASPDPADPAVTHRVLTVMRTEEY